MKNQELNFKIIDRYTNLNNFDKRESLLINEEPNLATLQFLLNEETDNELAKFIEILMQEMENEVWLPQKRSNSKWTI